VRRCGATATSSKAYPALADLDSPITMSLTARQPNDTHLRADDQRRNCGPSDFSRRPPVCVPRGLTHRVAAHGRPAASAAGCGLPSLPAAAGRVRAASTPEHVCEESTSQWTAGHKHPRQPPPRIRRPGLSRLPQQQQLPNPRPARRPTRQRPLTDTDSPRKSEEPTNCTNRNERSAQTAANQSGRRLMSAPRPCRASTKPA